MVEVAMRFLGLPGAPFKGRLAAPRKYSSNEDRDRAKRLGKPANDLLAPGALIMLEPQEYEDMKPDSRACYVEDAEWRGLLELALGGDPKFSEQYGRVGVKQRRAIAALLKEAGGLGADLSPSTLGGMNVKDSIEMINAANLSELDDLLKEERAGKDRKMVVNAILARTE